jgi:hypothetical protein
MSPAAFKRRRYANQWHWNLQAPVCMYGALLAKSLFCAGQVMCPSSVSCWCCPQAYLPKGNAGSRLWAHQSLRLLG